MVRLAIYLLQALDLALVIWGQQTFPPDVVTFPPPPTMTAVINNSVILFVGEPIVVGEDVRVTIDCSEVIDPVIAGGIPNPTIRWIKDGAELTGNGSAPNVDISEDRRRLIITDTLLAVGGQLGNDGNYTCEVCDDPTDVNCRNRTTCNAVCGFPNIMVPNMAPMVNNFLVSFGCGQDVEVESFATVISLIINCEAFNGSEPFVQEIYKDGELIQNGTSLSLLDTSPSDDSFGTYTFALSTKKCGSTTAVSRIIRQGEEVCSVTSVNGKVNHNQNRRRTRFRFSSDGSDPGIMYQCKLDDGRFKKCKSPRTWRNLRRGRHTITVRAFCVDDKGNRFSTVRKNFKFRVR